MKLRFPYSHPIIEDGVKKDHVTELRLDKMMPSGRSLISLAECKNHIEQKRGSPIPIKGSGGLGPGPGTFRS